jgi:hypothetical protein
MSSLSTCKRPTPPTMALGIRHCLLIIIGPVVRPAPTFCFVLFYFLFVIYFLDSVSFMFPQYQTHRHYPLVLRGTMLSVGSVSPDMPLPGSPTTMSRGPGTELAT